MEFCQLLTYVNFAVIVVALLVLLWPLSERFSLGPGPWVGPKPQRDPWASLKGDLDVLVGDAVQLNSGGPLMVVSDLSEGCRAERVAVWCVWWDGDKIETRAFDKRMLKRRLRSGEPRPPSLSSHP